MFYRVKIEKKRRETWVEQRLGGYRWEVEVFKDPGEDTRQDWELRGSGYCGSSTTARKKALKHLLGVEKDVANGLKFGVVFELAGTAEEIKRELEKVHYDS